MHLAIEHTTRYRFAEPVAYALQRLRLTPKETHGQRIAHWKVHYQGVAEELSYDDQNCNHVTLVSVEPGTTEVVITCEGIVHTEDHAGIIGRHAGHLPLWSFCSQTPYTRPGVKMRSLVATIRREESDILAQLHALSAGILEHVVYEAGHTGVDTTAEQALDAGKGVCQDHSHIFVGGARLLGIPARYVSGYLMMDDRVNQEATHAWAEAHVEGLGWVGFDVSNGISPDARYIRVATGRDYKEAAPITGISFGGVEEDLHVQLAVERQTSEQ
ncbi:transglutaminase [Croceicoccus estronivorus]|uniref:transglutaminase family protein n=1 Tax=Croceicoccus estronivorus TaxID=1172626 RepID=UPI000832E2B4|nr:transglutaminase family protein [Croceicoccus estronivorus]OCC25001.1 transglutaminase [Croceicoccus estronivorus]